MAHLGTLPELRCRFPAGKRVIARLSGMEPSNLPGTLTPDQAAVAARLLKARIFCPIHCRQFNKPGTYREHSDVEIGLREAANREGLRLVAAADGEPLHMA